MSNARLLIDNLADEATLNLATGEEISTMPLSNLQTYNNSRVFRTQDKEVEIEINLTEQQWISGLVLWKHNLTADATIHVTAFDVNETKVLDTGAKPAFDIKTLGEIEWGISELGENHFTGWRLAYSVFWFDIANAKKIIVKIDDQARTGPIDITRLYLGRAIEPEYNFSYGTQIEWVDNSRDYETAGASSYNIESEAWRETNLELANITTRDRPLLMEAFRKVKTQKDWFLSLYPEKGGQEERDHSFAVKLKKPVAMKKENIRYHKAKLQVREV